MGLGEGKNPLVTDEQSILDCQVTPVRPVTDEQSILDCEVTPVRPFTDEQSILDCEVTRFDPLQMSNPYWIVR
jgi:hypothetical protein